MIGLTLLLSVYWATIMTRMYLKRMIISQSTDVLWNCFFFFFFITVIIIIIVCLIEVKRQFVLWLRMFLLYYYSRFMIAVLNEGKRGGHYCWSTMRFTSFSYLLQKKEREKRRKKRVLLHLYFLFLSLSFLHLRFLWRQILRLISLSSIHFFQTKMKAYWYTHAFFWHRSLSIKIDKRELKLNFTVQHVNNRQN